MTRRLLVATTGIVGVLLLAGCAAAAPASSGAPSASAPQPSMSNEPAAGSTPTSAPLTCDTLVDAGVRASLIKNRWTLQQQPFRIGAQALDTGFVCAWSPTAAGSTSAQIYGYSPISAADASAAQSRLVAEGWRRQDAPEGVYISENPDTTVVADSDGYGMTYLFGAGWVIVSDTKQGLLVMNPPGTPAD